MSDAPKTTTAPAVTATKDISAINSACNEYAYTEAKRLLRQTSWPSPGATANEQGKLFQSCRDANFNNTPDVEDIGNLVAQKIIGREHLDALKPFDSKKAIR